tara:strand:+ start:2685 stop:3086 length:402 start_codon:yes stop_codon:yes gene_type:complete
MNRFVQEVIVSNDHLDDLMHVNNVQYLNWAQEIAKSHWNFLINKFKEPYGIWMVRHHDVTYKAGSYLNDVIEISTYVKSVKGPISFRIIEFHNKNDNKLLVKICTKWCYINNLNDRKIIKIPDNIVNLFKVKN